MPTPDENLKHGYPKGAKYDFAWPFDYPEDSDPHYENGPLFDEEESAKPIGDVKVKPIRVPTGER